MSRAILRIVSAALVFYLIGTALTVWSLHELKADACPVDSKVCV